MDSKYGFLRMSIDEFEDYISSLKIGRTVLKILLHHTYIPSYIHFEGDNHFALQNGMKGAHLNNGWNDIGQHLSVFPDGSVLTGRSWETAPACIYGSNSEAVCIENVGNFDRGGDKMKPAQKDAIIRVTAALCKKFNLIPNTNNLLYHHWFNMITGERNNGTAHNKTCPGTDFFGGNSVEACQKHFIPLIENRLEEVSAKIQIQDTKVLEYVWSTAGRLNVRSGPSTDFPKAADRKQVEYGSILRVYKKQDNWLKISQSSSHWVSALYTKPVRRARVMTDILNVRSGPSAEFPKLEKVRENSIVYEYNHQNGWSQIDVESKWVSSDYLRFGLLA